MVNFERTPKNLAILVVFIGTILRVLTGIYMGLGVDESYAAVISKQFSLSYFDHPPLHIWIVGFARYVFKSEAPLLLRTPFILMFIGTCYFMFRSTSILFSQKTAFLTVLLLNISAVFSLAGGWILPDGPLLFFMSITFYLWVRILFCDEGKPHLWILSGISLGLSCLSKYHGVFLGIGLLAHIVTQKEKRVLFLSIWPYVMAFSAFLIFLPVIIWNIQHDWISFLFHTNRGGFKGIYPLKVLLSLLGQALWILPWIWGPLFYIYIKEALRGTKNEKIWFLLCLGSGPILFFTIPTLWGAENLPHWQAPGYFFLLPLLAKFFDDQLPLNAYKIKKYFAFSSIIYTFLLMVILSICSTAWLQHLKPEWFKKGDPSWECLDWNGINLWAFQKFGFTFIASSHWIDAAKLDYGLRGKYPVLCLKGNQHHFQFLYDLKTFENQNGLIIIFRGKEKVTQDFGKYFNSIEYLGEIPIYRMGKKEFDLSVYLGKGFCFKD